MYELGAERAGVPPEQCVYVDDLPFNLTARPRSSAWRPSTTRAPRQTIPELERLLEIPLRDGR